MCLFCMIGVLMASGCGGGGGGGAASTETVSGVLQDTFGDPLVGYQVALDGSTSLTTKTASGTPSVPAGSFSLTVPVSAVLGSGQDNLTFTDPTKTISKVQAVTLTKGSNSSNNVGVIKIATPTESVSGVLQDTYGVPLVGYHVALDGSATLVGVTVAAGVFSLTVPVSVVAGSGQDNLTFADPNRTFDRVQTVSLARGANAVNNVGVIHISTPTETVDGVLEDNSGNPLAGYKVDFNNISGLYAISGSSGAFSLTVGVTDVVGGGQDKLAFYDTNGVLNQVVFVSVTQAAGSVNNVGTINIGPPGPVVRHKG